MSINRGRLSVGFLGIGFVLLSNHAFAGVAFNLEGFEPWPLKNGQVQVCIRAPEDSNLRLKQKDYDSFRKDAVTVLNETWGRAPGLSFNESCSPSDPSQIVLTLTNQAGWGQCGSGKGAACTVGASATDPVAFRRVLVHEVGHGLGLAHEHQTPTNQPLCLREQVIYDGCLQCADGECSAQDYKDCFLLGTAPSPVVKLPPTGDYSQAAAKDRQLQREPDYTARALTRYDPLSLMGYCQVDFNGPGDSHNPTVFDLLAVEMLYSADRNYGLGCDVGCLLTKTGVVISSTGSLVSEWTGRGAYNIPMRISGSNAKVFSLAASQLPAGFSTLSYTFRDPWDNPRHGGGTVERSDAKFAAMVSLFTAQ